MEFRELYEGLARAVWVLAYANTAGRNGQDRADLIHEQDRARETLNAAWGTSDVPGHQAAVDRVWAAQAALSGCPPWPEHLPVAGAGEDWFDVVPDTPAPHTRDGLEIYRKVDEIVTAFLLCNDPVLFFGVLTGYAQVGRSIESIALNLTLEYTGACGSEIEGIEYPSGEGLDWRPTQSED